ncbi:MAG TPA: ATP-dependent protease, partial [Betaproteobacteria bacterium]|nr:ATP-dependent protease [Betaproteobacteria bacterium]
MKETLTPLAPGALHQCCDPAGFAFDTTDDLPDLHEIIGQERAFDAVRFGVGIRRDGYNLFVLGPGGLGKHSFVRDFLTRRAGEEERPPDWCYLNNFSQPHRPQAVKLPSGTGVKLRQDMEQLLEELRAVVPAAFESDEYRARLGEIDVAFKERQQAAFKELEAAAGKQGVALLQTPGGFAFGPVRDGEVIAPEDYEKLPAKEKSRIEAVVSVLQERLQKIIHQVPLWRRERRDKLKDLDREIGKGAIFHAIDAIKAEYAAFPELADYLEAVHQDVIAHVDHFRKPEEGLPAMANLPAAGFSFFQRYRV